MLVVNVVELPNTVKLPLIDKSCDTLNEPVIVPPVNGKALLALLYAEAAYWFTDVMFVFCVASTPVK